MALDKNMVYQSHMINNTPTIVGEAGAAIDDVRCKGVKFNENGKIVLANTAGETIIGVAILTNNSATAEGDDVDVQIRDNGILMVAADVAAGAELAVDASGTFVTATAGQFVAAVALEAGKAGQVVRAMMTRYTKA